MRRFGKPSRKIIVLCLCLSLLLLAVGAGAYIKLKHPLAKTATTTPRAAINQQNPPTSRSTIRLLAAGDFIAHASVNNAAKQPDGSYNYLPLISDFGPVLAKADIRFCNDPILNGGDSLGISDYPIFNSPAAFVNDMNKLGCNLVNTASNHSFDFAQSSINASVDVWRKQPNMMAVAGENRNQQERDEVHYFTVKGVKFAFLAYTTYNNSPPQNDYGVNVFSKEFASAQINTAKQNGAQAIIVSIRWGNEYSSTATVFQRETAKYLADLGVNLVLGHGSHQLQPVEELNGAAGNKTMVWYSIGNFVHSQIPAETVFNGLPVIDFDAKTLQITRQQFLPTYMHYEWTATQAQAEQIDARHNLRLYLLEKSTQQMIDAQQLHTTVEAQKQRIASILSTYGAQIPLITNEQYNQ